MKALRESTRSVLDTDESDTEINYARNMDYLRGVKRLCFGLADDVAQERGRAFLETKWDLETTKKRREFTCLRVFGFRLQGAFLTFVYR